MGLEQHLLQAWPALRRYAMSLCHNPQDAQDLVQTAMARAWERAERLSGLNGDAVNGYLFRTVRNAWIDEVRKRALESPGDPPVEEGRWDDLTGPEAEAMLAALPETLRHTARLRAKGLRGEEIARAMGIPAATVRTRLRAARLYLQSHHYNGKDDNA